VLELWVRVGIRIKVRVRVRDFWGTKGLGTKRLGTKCLEATVRWAIKRATLFSTKTRPFLERLLHALCANRNANEYATVNVDNGVTLHVTKF